MMKKKILSKFRIWSMAIRPQTLPASIVPVIIGFAIAVKKQLYHIPTALITLFTAILIQVLTNLINDYSDFKKGADDEKRLGPTRVTQAGLVTEREIKTGIFFIFLLIIISSVYLVIRGGIPILAIGILSLTAGYFYTGGPFPYGYYGYGDIFVLIFFGPVSVAGTYFLQSLSIDISVIIIGFGPGLISVAILIVNNIRDLESDMRAGKNTLIVRLGRNFGLFEYIFSLVSASLIPVFISLYYPQIYSYSFISVFVIILIYYPYKILTNEKGKELNKILGFTGKILIIYGILFSIGLFL